MKLPIDLPPNVDWMIWAIWLLPLAAFAVIIFLSLLSGRSRASFFAIGATSVSLFLSVWLLFIFLNSNSLQSINSATFQWLAIGNLNIVFNLFIDSLVAIMLVVVNTVSLMVQVYSRGYMHADPGHSRYYAFLSLFTFSMLGLVIAGNLLLTFMCWELVGLCSYLLIGFWFHRPAAAAAAKKAFLVTRMGDIGFLVALLVLYGNTGTLNIVQLNDLASTGAIGLSVLTIAAIGLFAGAAGKSAQFPLHVWLPDAMEGPTPVSALIHAATMVAAGVFLVARMYPLFSAAPDVLTGIAIVGGFTAIFAATMGLVMTDVKRVLAYSTVSQLGYMMVGLGTGGVAIGIFHLFNHAFFKALLFLGAGSLSHATGTFDMRQMGGLRKALPTTFATFLIAALALAGVWPLSGFFSKEGILTSALDKNPLLFAVMLLTAFMTAFYIFRVLFMVFGGSYRGTEHPHESPRVMLIPMLVLAVLAIGSGWLNATGGFDSFLSHVETHSWVSGIFGVLEHSLSWASLLAAGLGIFLAYAIYAAAWLSPTKVRRFFRSAYAVFIHKYWLDDLYENLLARTLLYRGIFQGLSFFDRQVVDGTMNGLGQVSLGAGRLIRRAQTGQLQIYGTAAFLGIIVLTLIMVLVK
jgi:NADH-quinone oxidoreductase subunit L